MEVRSADSENIMKKNFDFSVKFDFAIIFCNFPRLKTNMSNYLFSFDGIKKTV